MSSNGGRLPPDLAADAARAERLAGELLREAEALRRRPERRQAARMARLLADPEGRSTILALTDEVLRIHEPARAAQVLAGLAAGDGLRSMPAAWRRASWLSPPDRAALVAGALLAPVAPRLVVPAARARVVSETSGVVLPARRARFRRHVQLRRRQAARLNVNVLGEAVLGEDEATRRMDRVLEVLARPEVDYVSVKISAICSQLDVLAFDDEVERIAARLRVLYRAAAASRPAKFVNLDMEEYRDLGLTVAVFRRVLDEEEFRPLDAGIVLQAYLPDSAPAMSELCRWAAARRAAGGGRTKIRIVKGANLAMETVEAELHGWVRAPFATKAEADANYKRMLEIGLSEGPEAVRLGIASHNLFELAWAAVRAEACGSSARVEFEMLEGMSPAAALAVARRFGSVLLYAPIVERSDLDAAIAYLVRRLDENSAPDNFIAHQYGMTAGSADWEEQRRRFRQAVSDSCLPTTPPRRAQDRDSEQGMLCPPGSPFTNVPDTDFTSAANRRWAARHVAAALSSRPRYRPVVSGCPTDDDATERGVDPSRPGEDAYTWAPASVDTVEAAITAARSGHDSWAGLAADERRQILHGAAAALASARGRLLGAMCTDSGKTVREGDPEVSEAVDFAAWYADHIPGPGSGFRPYGTVVVAAPWNFPLSIPAGGILAALAAGNTVILKPAPETVAVAGELVRALWEGGVPPEALHFVPCVDGEASRRLITSPEVDAVVLTGSWETARMFLDWRPDLALHAETSGKNAIVVTGTADPDEAIADIVRSAFGHAGQKCSAASLAIIEAAVHDDGRFLDRLADAVRSLRVGPAAAPSTVVGPLIRPPGEPLRSGLTELQPGERWLVEPRQLDTAGYLWSPGVKVGVSPGAPAHLTEYFGPVLAIMRAADLPEAVRLQNAPDYGLTAGLSALDPAEIDYWRGEVQAGNLYVNRSITGAVVGRQPFGGWKRSVVGPGAKAGGPNYVASLGRWPALGDAPSPGVAEYRRAWRRVGSPVDVTGLRSESNVLRHRPLGVVALLGSRGRQAAQDAAAAMGVRVVDSVDQPVDKVRVLDPLPEEHLRRLHRTGAWVDDLPVQADPEREVARWAREQAVSESRHRHGNVTSRRPGLLPPPPEFRSV